MEIRTLRTFVTAADKMNFSKAAEELGYTQSAVTIQIQKLEQELGIPLFERIGKHIFLTEKGKQFLVQAQDLLYQIDHLSNSLKPSSVSGETIRIGLSESLFAYHFHEIILQFQAQHPSVRFLFQTGVRDRLNALMRRNELDLAFLIDRNIIDQDWTGEILGADTAFFAASASHPLTRRTRITIEDILKEKLILTEHNFGYSYELLQILARENRSVTCSLETGNTEFIRSVLLNTDYVSFLPLYVIKKEVMEKQLRIFPLPEYHVTVYRQIYWHRNKYLTPAMLEFVSLIRQMYSVSPPQY